jgi:hypothetical protein
MTPAPAATYETPASTVHFFASNRTHVILTHTKQTTIENYRTFQEVGECLHAVPETCGAPLPAGRCRVCAASVNDRELRCTVLALVLLEQLDESGDVSSMGSVHLLRCWVWNVRHGHRRAHCK